MRIFGIVMLVFAGLNLIVAFVAAANGATDAAGSKLSAAIFLGIIGGVFYYFGNKKKTKTKEKSSINKHEPSQFPLDNKTIMETVRKVGQNGNGLNYWHGFKLRKPNDADAIEKMCGRDIANMSDADSFQIVTTFLRWSKNAGMPLSSLKDNFVKQIHELISEGATFEMIMDKIKNEKRKEAQQFNISEEFTISNFMYEWLVDMQTQQQTDDFATRMARKMNIPEEEIDSFKKSIQEKEKELNLAPDISKLDREENRLFYLAKECVDIIDSYKPLSEQGKIEALILCSTYTINLRTDFKNEIDLDDKQDRYFLLLADNTIDENIEDQISFLNSRIAFYQEETKKLATQSHYTPMFIYNALFMNPLCEHPEILKDFKESPFELLSLHGVLINVQKYVAEKKSLIL